jgi:hypothetical protein
MSACHVDISDGRRVEVVCLSVPGRNGCRKQVPPSFSWTNKTSLVAKVETEMIRDKAEKTFYIVHFS